MSALEPPAQDDRWDEPIEKTSEPLGGWDREHLKHRVMSLWDLSYSEAEQKLMRYGPGRLCTLLDQEVQQ